MFYIEKDYIFPTGINSVKMMTHEQLKLLLVNIMAGESKKQLALFSFFDPTVQYTAAWVYWINIATKVTCKGEDVGQTYGSHSDGRGYWGFHCKVPGMQILDLKIKFKV